MVIAVSLQFVAWWKIFGSQIWKRCLKINFKDLLLIYVAVTMLTCVIM